MVSIRKRKIKANDYLYTEHSFRLPDGKIKKISKLIHDSKEAYSSEIKNYFLVKEAEAYYDYVSSRISPDSVLTSDKIAKLERFRVEYKFLLNRLTPAQFKDLLDRFTVNFTYESNALEGNSLTLKDVTLILKENQVPKNKDLWEVYETRNTREVIEALFNHQIKITLKDILRIHEMLVRDTGISTGFKKVPNFLMMRTVKTTSPEKVQEEMESLLEWYVQNRDKLHPLKLAASFHGRFEKIHPFEDGNGRIGRILINAIFLEQGYPPLIIRKTTRMAYFSALEAFDNGYELKLERFLLSKLEDTFEKFFHIYIQYL